MDLNKNMVRNCPSCGSDNVEMYMPYPSVCDFHIRCKECNVTGQAGIVEQDGLLKWKILPRGEVIVQQKFCDQIEKLLKEELEVSGFPENVIESMKKESSAVISSFRKMSPSEFEEEMFKLFILGFGYLMGKMEEHGRNES
jgi:hypothetical protein